jgi:Zn-dependent M32 family carboxypeptidase
MELLKDITGTGLTAQPYLRYLRGKFGEIYDL